MAAPRRCRRRTLRGWAARHGGPPAGRIESRPAPRRAWEYVFFLDLDGHEADETIAAALRDIEGASAEVKLLGSYPRGQAVAPGT